MNRLDAGRQKGPRPNNRNRNQTTGIRIIKAGPPPTDYTKHYKPEHGCPLTSYMKEYFSDNQQTQTDYKQKNDIRNWIEECFERFSLDYTCYIVGSTSNGFGTKSSDVDICLVIDHEREQVSKSETMKALKKARTAMRNCGHPGSDIELIPAKVPILRLYRQGVQIDINCNNLTGLRNTWLLNAYSAVSPKLKEPRIRPLAMFVKKIAKRCKINNPMDGTLSSYSFNLLVTHFCQTRDPPILPVIQKDAPEINIHTSLKALPMLIKTLPQWKSENTESLSELLQGFFAYYAEFDFNKVISVRLGDAVPVVSDHLLKPNHDSLKDKNMRIEEPFDGTNTARAVYQIVNFARIKYTFKHVAKVIARAQESGADLYNLLENEIRPESSELETYLDNYQESQKKSGDYYNIGRRIRGTGTHIIIESSDSEQSGSEFQTTDSYVCASSSEEETKIGGKRPAEQCSGGLDESDRSTKIRKTGSATTSGVTDTGSGCSTTTNGTGTVEKGGTKEKQTKETSSKLKTQTSREPVSVDDDSSVLDESSKDEGIGSKETIDLTSDNEESKTKVLDQRKKMLLKKMLLAKMNKESSDDESSSGEESSGESEDSDVIMEKVVERPKTKKVFKRRNKNVESNVDETDSVPVQLPQPQNAHANNYTPTQIMDRFLRADEDDETL